MNKLDGIIDLSIARSPNIFFFNMVEDLKYNPQGLEQIGVSLSSYLPIFWLRGQRYE